jgi:hypothetical protein
MFIIQATELPFQSISNEEKNSLTLTLGEQSSVSENHYQVKVLGHSVGAKAFSIITFSITGLHVTQSLHDTQHKQHSALPCFTLVLSVVMLVAAFLSYAECRCSACHYAGCSFLFIVMLSVIMMSVVLLNDVAAFCQSVIRCCSWIRSEHMNIKLA